MHAYDTLSYHLSLPVTRNISHSQDEATRQAARAQSSAHTATSTRTPDRPLHAYSYTATEHSTHHL